MSSTNISWGDDRTRFAGYALAHAAVVLRLLLPLRRAEDGARVRWTDAAASLGSQQRIDAYTNLFQQLEFPGSGPPPDQIYLPPAGRIPNQTVDAMKSGLRAALGEVRWRSDRSLASQAVSTRLSTQAVSQAEAVRAHPPELVGTLDEISDEWPKIGFPGRAWTVDGKAGIAAPLYADSLVLSGPRMLVAPLLAAGPEVFVVDRHHIGPITWE